MSESLNRGSERPETHNPEPRLMRRVLTVMAGSVLLAVVISRPFVSWRVTAGLLLGGILSLLNIHWMRNSIAATFDRAAEGTMPRIRIAQFVLRYFIIGIVVYAGYRFDVVSLTATVAGLSSFVVALFAEALRESYFIFIHREEIH